MWGCPFDKLRDRRFDTHTVGELVEPTGLTGRPFDKLRDRRLAITLSDIPP
ncbi:MAG: hypothetical protein LBS86_00550 [Treponema sp.]|nr:hypothetical protein [Treponema sp.]